jgi:uncharacterized membrane protein
VSYLSERGQAVGRANTAGTDRAFFFSRKTGYVDLQRAPYTASAAQHINASGTIVGAMGFASPGGTQNERAFRWSNKFVAVDLNTRLINPPAGLVLTGAFGISTAGDILANSNAGLVMLRRGGTGADAPVLGPIQVSPVRLNEVTTLTVAFSDRNLRDTHTATVDWGDGSGPQPATVSETKGRGEISAQHTYTTFNPETFAIVVRVTDSTGKTTVLGQLASFAPPAP